MKPYKHIPLLFLIFLITFSSTVFASSPVLKNGLGLGDNGEQVKILQSKLSEDKTLYPSGLISGYYGNLTQQAVKKFQQKYSLIQTGNLDANTLEKFNQIYGDNIQPTPTPVPKKNIIKSFFDFITSPIRSIISLFNRTDNNNQNTENSSQAAEVPTRIPTPTTYYISPTIDPDPFVNCGISTECGGGTKLLRSSICSQSSCCQINGKWIYYDSVDKCKQDQNSANRQNSQNNYKLPNNTNTNGNNNVNQINSGSIKIKCDYSDSRYQYDFGEITYDECTIKSNEYWASKRVTIPTYSYQPSPTPTQPKDDSRCSQAYNMWIEYRNDFLANKMNTYDNSAEAMVAFENEKQYIQNLINSYGCSITLH